MRDGTKSLPGVLVRYSRPITIAANLTVLVGAYVFAFLLRFDFTIPDIVRDQFWVTLPVAVVIEYATFSLFHLTRGWWRYVGVTDFLNAVKAAFLANALFATGVLFMRLGFPRSILLLNPILLIGFSIGARLAVRLWRHVPVDHDDRKRRRLLIIGAGDTGELLLRELREARRLNYNVVAFVDDDPAKIGAYINGVPVVGDIQNLKDTTESFSIDEIIVATPSASGAQMRVIIDRCMSIGLPFKVMPATWEVLAGRAGLHAAREVNINDLLRRPPVELDMVTIGRFLNGRNVLVTGAAGSIGQEICHQVLRFEPKTLISLDHDENALFFLERRLSERTSSAHVEYQLCDCTDPIGIRAIFDRFHPEVVFHAAAHKHVPVIEKNPVEGVRNNVLGTETVARIAGEKGAEAFVLISTDKAVNPTSVMGASKRISELLIQTLDFDTRYTAVRFGNVLGSQGSVVPIFKEQIARGGPIHVTHPEMRRYFMTIPEAVELVIQAGAMGGGEEIFVLDMGEPVKIVDLANDLIRLSGLRPNLDIPIVYDGIRPGEKLFEELCLDAEDADRTKHPKILVARQSSHPPEFKALLERLRAAVNSCDTKTVLRLLPAMVPEFRHHGEEKIVPIASAKRATPS